MQQYTESGETHILADLIIDEEREFDKDSHQSLLDD